MPVLITKINNNANFFNWCIGEFGYSSHCIYMSQVGCGCFVSTGPVATSLKCRSRFDCNNSCTQILIGSNLNNMQNLFSVNWMNVKSALTSAILAVILGISGYIIGIGDLWQIDVHSLINIGTMSFLVSIVSLLKSFLTDNKGDFAGVVKITPTSDIPTD